MNLYFNNEKEFSNMWYVFSYGALYAYKNRLLEFDMLDFYLFQMSAMEIFRDLNINESLIDYIGGAIQIEDVELWYVDEIPAGILNRFIQQLRLEINEYILEELIEYNKFEFVPYINETDKGGLRLTFFNEYTTSIYFNLLLLGILQLICKRRFYDCFIENIEVFKNILQFLMDYQDYYRNELLINVYQLFIDGNTDYELLLVKAELAIIRCIKAYFNTSQENLIKNTNLLESEGLPYRVMKL